MLFQNLRLEQKVSKIASHGFKHVDFWSWRGRDFTDFRRALKEHGVNVTSIVSNMENSPTIAGDYDLYLAEVRDSIRMAQSFDCTKLIALSDAMSSVVPGTEPPVMPAKTNPASPTKKMANLLKALRKVVDMAEKEDVVFCLEALNPMDHPGYFLDSSSPAFDVVDRLASKNLRVLYDIYHMQVAEGNITSNILKNIKNIGYLHFADVPGRHEPGTGELNFGFILSRLRRAGYDGNLEFEYSPLKGDDRSLSIINDITAHSS